MKARRLLSLLLAALMLVGILTAGVTVSAADLPFGDTDGHWGEAAIEYVYSNGLMNGVGNGESFAPDMSLTRGMVVTVLYRNNGSPDVDFKGAFLDVEEGAYYTAAAEWAYDNEIVTGTGTDDWGEPYFSPDRDITRQELATMFGRYAAFKHVDTTKKTADISTYPDAADVASWASDTVKWSVGVGLITGKSNGGAATLSPLDKASRAEFATIIQRYNTKEGEFEYHLVYEAPVVQSTYTEKEYPLVDDADIYVAVDGNDSNPGTLDAPLATFEGAKAKVRELKKTAKDDIVVAFKAGDYGILDNVTFSSEDSGTENISVTYCAYGDGEVYFTNGLYIGEDEFKALDESDMAFFSEEYADSIRKVELSDHPLADQITSFSPLSSSDGFCTIARTPNKRNGIDSYYPGFSYFALLPDSPLTYEELVEHNNTDFSAAETDSHIYQDRFFVTRVLKERLDTYDSYDGVQLCGYISKVWHQDVFTITSYDKETGLVTYDGRPPWGFYAKVGGQTQIYVSNASRELDCAGEYWIDPEAKALYVYAPQGAYTIGMADTFATLQTGADNISFVGLNFRTCKGVGIYANGDNFKMDQCSVMYVGGSYALHSGGALGIEITNSTFAYCHESGVHVRGPEPGRREGYDYYALNNTGFVFENNLIHDVDMASVPVESGCLLYSYQIGGRIAHNEIYNSGRYGIDFKYGNLDCVMEYNYLHHCMQNSADGGAFYCGRVATNRGNTIRYNIIADIYALNPIHTGGTFAIYMDDGMENLICYANVFYNSGTIMNNGGRSHVFYDNVFIKKGSGIVGKDANFQDISKYADSAYADGDAFNEGWNSLDKIPDESTPNGQLWKSKWPELYDIVAIRRDPSCYKETDLYKAPLNYCHNNYTIDGAEHSFFEEWLEYSDHENNVDIPAGENPLFVNPTIGDYTVKDGADIIDNHFAKIGRY